MNELVPLLSNFSFTLCAERDGMNHDLLVWYDAWFSIVSRKERANLVSWSAIFAPWYHASGLVNSYFHARILLPKP